MTQLLTTATKGIFPICPTPFFEDGEVDLASLDGLVDWYAACGVSGLIALGVFGEAAKLSPEEGEQVLKRGDRPGGRALPRGGGDRQPEASRLRAAGLHLDGGGGGRPDDRADHGRADRRGDRRRPEADLRCHRPGRAGHAAGLSAGQRRLPVGAADLPADRRVRADRRVQERGQSGAGQAGGASARPAPKRASGASASCRGAAPCSPPWR